LIGFWKMLWHFLLKPVTRCLASEACEGTLVINWAQDEWDVICSPCLDELHLQAVGIEDQCACEYC